MSKLTFKTKPPRKGCVNHQSFMTHETVNLRDKYPPSEVQNKAHKIVSETMWELIRNLKELGYDETKVGFYIHYLNNI
ncbi:hypothetical protein [Flavobacterium aquicola]|uniref:Uncharacterized protein n=1 Tax=Flavobacterium aquicola TaxID=1682742 RepID=A0A3E0ESZ4_9FLAO|nr:hypothetical protein [Flavobacterium aquicola]REH00287.1 hypothetical protein C8P67_103263 [Flavobacterium aquicola]